MQEVYETSAATGCIVENFPDTPYANYRYFNQPIEQIPGWDSSKPQILFHAKDAGLIWVGIQCLPVVTCVQISGVSSPEDPLACNCELSITRHNIYILKDAGINETECEIQTLPLNNLNIDGPYKYNQSTNQWETINPTT